MNHDRRAGHRVVLREGRHATPVGASGLSASQLGNRRRDVRVNAMPDEDLFDCGDRLLKPALLSSSCRHAMRNQVVADGRELVGSSSYWIQVPRVLCICEGKARDLW